jgi:hypothetical protein
LELKGSFATIQTPMNTINAVKRVSLVLGFILFLLPGFALAANSNIKVTVGFDKRTVDIDKEVRMKISIDGARGGIERPRVPQLNGFHIYYLGRSSEVSIVNGKMTSLTQFTFTLVPIAVGKYKLPPIDVEVGDTIYRTPTSEIEVLGKAGMTTNPRAAAPSLPATLPRGPVSRGGGPTAPIPTAGFSTAEAGDPIFMRAWVDQANIYLGEQITLTYSIYYRADASLERFEEEPVTTGFWTEELPMEKQPQKKFVKVSGLKYETTDFRRLALFPTRSGTLTLDPGTMRATVVEQPVGQSRFVDDFFNDSFFRSGGFFAKKVPKLLSSPPIKITVKPLPKKGRPVDFEGAVGDFHFQAGIDKRSVRQYEPVVLEMVIDGRGNLETLERPKLPELAGVRVYDSDMDTQLNPRGTEVAGRKTFEVTLIPSEMGTLEIPPLEFTFFNPRTKSYQTQKSSVFQINVTEGDESASYDVPELTSLSSDDGGGLGINNEIDYIRHKLSINPLRDFDSIIRIIFSWIAGLLTLVTLFIVWRHRKEAFYAQNLGLKRRLKAHGKASKEIRRVAKLLKDKDPVKQRQFFAKANSAMNQYLADKFNLAAQGLTLTEVEAQLKHFEIEEDLQHKIIRFYEVTDRARFAPTLAMGSEAQEMVQILQETVEHIEKKIR